MKEEFEFQISDILMKRITDAAAEHGLSPCDIIPILISQGLHWQATMKGKARINAAKETASMRLN